MECETLNHQINNNKRNDLGCFDETNRSELETIARKRRAKIDLIRGQFKEDYEKNKDLYEPEDYEKVMNKDFWITRYMVSLEEDPKLCLERVISSMRWRKSYEIKHFDPCSLPREFYQVSALFHYQPDKHGRPTMYVRGKIHRKIRELESRIKQYLVNRIDKIDAVKESHESWLLIIDATDASFLNTDMEMIMFLFQTLRNRFPQGVAQAFIYGLPWILGAFANMVLSILPSDSVSKIKFGGKKELSELIGEENLPDFMGGSCQANYRLVPRQAMDVYELGERELGLKKEEIDNLLKPFKQHIQPIEMCQLVDS